MSDAVFAGRQNGSESSDNSVFGFHVTIVAHFFRFVKRFLKVFCHFRKVFFENLLTKQKKRVIMQAQSSEFDIFRFRISNFIRIRNLF